MPYAEAEYAAAIGQGQFRLMFQPMLARDSRRVAGVEALVRWQHPRRGFLGPAAFLPVMERAGQMGALTDWTIGRAAQTCVEWRESGLTVPVSVNLSATLLHDAGLADRVSAQLDLVGMPAELLTLEVTETALAEPGRGVSRILGHLRRTGIGIAVDDFGTGYTSLAILKNYTFDELKIDRSFIAPLRHSPADAAIVRSVLELGHRLDLTVVAEGIEDEATARLLEELGCDVLQGFHFAKPGTVEQTLQVIQSRGTTSNRGTTGRSGPRNAAQAGCPRAVESSKAPVPARNTATDRAGVGPDRARDSVVVTVRSAGDGCPTSENARLTALTALHVLDTEPEPMLDDLVEIAAAVCDTPAALLSFVDRDRQWFKARLGVMISEAPREGAFCSHAIRQPGEVFMVPDARQDERFAANPLVTGEPYVRFYAGAPMVTADGHAVGTLCVLDTVARTLSATQRGALHKLANLAMNHLHVNQTEIVMQNLQQVSRVLSRMHTEQDVPDAASAVAVAAREILEADGAVAFLPEEPGSVIFRPAGVAVDSTDSAAAIAAVIVDSRDDRAAAAVIRSCQPLFIADAPHQDLPESELVPVVHAVSGLYLPLQDEATVIGVLAIWWTTPQETRPPAALTALSLLADETGNTLARLYALTALRTSADSDLLTGLLNRRAFAAAFRGFPPDSAVIMIDLDHFQRINDRHGYQAGDQALKSFAAHLRAAVRAEDLTARWGGEQFALAVPRGGADSARSILDRLRQSWTGGLTTFSAGVTVLASTERATAALERADMALHAAKHAGRDRDEYAPAPPRPHPHQRSMTAPP